MVSRINRFFKNNEIIFLDPDNGLLKKKKIKKFTKTFIN